MAQWLGWPPDLFQASRLLCVLGIVALAGSVVIGPGSLYAQRGYALWAFFRRERLPGKTNATV